MYFCVSHEYVAYANQFIPQMFYLQLRIIIKISDANAKFTTEITRFYFSEKLAKLTTSVGNEKCWIYFSISFEEILKFLRTTTLENKILGFIKHLYQTRNKQPNFYFLTSAFPPTAPLMVPILKIVRFSFIHANKKADCIYKRVGTLK